MAAITNQQVVKHCNEICRVIADATESYRRTVEKAIIEIVLIEGLSDYQSAQDSDSIADGSAGDGRKQVTKLNHQQLKYVLGQVKDCLQADDREDIVNRWTTNSRPLF